MPSLHHCMTFQNKRTKFWRVVVYHLDGAGCPADDHITGYLFKTKERAEEAGREWCKDRGLETMEGR